MIKSVHRLYVAGNDRRFRALVEFFDLLGLELGESWKGKRSSGAKLEAPQSGVEIGCGEGFPDADLVIEVDTADSAYELVKKNGYKFAEDIADCDWGARMFTVELPDSAGRVAIFSYNEQWRENEPGNGRLDARGRTFAIVVSRFNSFITERMLLGAVDALMRSGAPRENIKVVRVPGAFEIPSAARDMAQTGKYDAIVCIGCLIRGETLHYEVIANEVARGIGQSAQDTGVPHGFGVLTVENLEQAIDRAGLKAGNKGFEAAMAAVEMANLRAGIRGPAGAGSSRKSSSPAPTGLSAKRIPPARNTRKNARKKTTR